MQFLVAEKKLMLTLHANIQQLQKMNSCEDRKKKKQKSNLGKLNSMSHQVICSPCSLVWIRRSPPKRVYAGSNPARGTQKENYD